MLRLDGILVPLHCWTIKLWFIFEEKWISFEPFSPLLWLVKTEWVGLINWHHRTPCNTLMTCATWKEKKQKNKMEFIVIQFIMVQFCHIWILIEALNSSIPVLIDYFDNICLLHSFSWHSVWPSFLCTNIKRIVTCLLCFIFTSTT